jgi:hypothetical protein
MKFKEETIEKVKKMMQTRDEDITEEQAQEAAENLARYAELVYKIAERQTRLRQRLKKEPRGFPVEDTYSCLICHTTIGPENSWYDWYGQKCLNCQRAIDNGTIPGFICQNSNSYYSSWKIKDAYKTNITKVKKWVKEGRLTARLILNEQGGVHEYIFLKKENPQLILEKWNPIRKSYDRKQKKLSQKWVREESEKMKKELKLGKYKPKKANTVN